ncbi:glycosyltransferase family 4 protein [Haloplanus halophilus]|uniref:glycosyltransferase family 4 protein n=1 Tax=Haloplanus halophilus TaxID=2949993 RepID=UPI00203A8FBF|nr:glycosyltransferase family 1 protein [Haloplanus sp. GDY1]
MLTVGVDARVLGKPEPTGVSRYTASLLGALGDGHADDAEFVLFGLDDRPASLDAADGLRLAPEPAPHSGLRAHLWEQVRLPVALRRYDLDVFHAPAGAPPYTGTPTVATIHDISPVVHPEWFSAAYGALYRLLTAHTVRTADRIVTVSGFARDEIVERYPAAAERTVPIHNGVTPRDRSAGSPVASLDGEAFLLFVGAMNPRKNLRTLVESYDRYRDRVEDPATLALAGPSREVFADGDAPRPEGVRTLGFVPESTLSWLYREATAFVFPSLYEGFGLPILEAMSAGTPVITSNRGAMAEVAGDAALLVDPERPAALADAMERVTAAKTVRDDLRRRGRVRARAFTWERAARRTMAVYREVADGR